MHFVKLSRYRDFSKYIWHATRLVFESCYTSTLLWIYLISINQCILIWSKVEARRANESYRIPFDITYTFNLIFFLLTFWQFHRSVIILTFKDIISICPHLRVCSVTHSCVHHTDFSCWIFTEYIFTEYIFSISVMVYKSIVDLASISSLASFLYLRWHRFYIFCQLARLSRMYPATSKS